MKIAVLTGGFSREREISLITGKTIAQALKNRGHLVNLLDINIGNLPIIQNLWEHDIFEVAIIAIHGEFGEDGKLQKYLEEFHIPYAGCDSQCSHLAMDKFQSKNEFDKNNVLTPDYLFYNNESATELLKKINLPVVVKPIAEGSSIGVRIAKSFEELQIALEKSREYENLLIESYIAGREMNVAILAGKALPLLEIKPSSGFYDFNAKYISHNTEYIVNPELTTLQAQVIKNEALKAYHALGCQEYARVDLILSEQGQPFVLEINTIPGMTPTSLFPKAAQAVGISFEELCEKIALMGLSKATKLRESA